MSWEGHGIKNRSGKSWNLYGISVGRMDIFLLATRIFFPLHFTICPNLKLLICVTPHFKMLPCIGYYCRKTLISTVS